MAKEQKNFNFKKFRWALKNLYGILCLTTIYGGKNGKYIRIFIKNRKTFQGLDWQGNQGNLYYNGKKVAWYNDSGSGGSCDIVYYDNSYAPILEETIKRYFKERPIITEYGELDGDEDLFMAELLQLMDDEKEYKKAVKKDYSCLVTYTDANTHFSYSMMCNEDTAQKMHNRTDIKEIKIYRSEKDFIIE